MNVVDDLHIWLRAESSAVVPLSPNLTLSNSPNLTLSNFVLSLNYILENKILSELLQNFKEVKESIR